MSKLARPSRSLRSHADQSHILTPFIIGWMCFALIGMGGPLLGLVGHGDNSQSAGPLFAGENDTGASGLSLDYQYYYSPSWDNDAYSPGPYTALGGGPPCSVSQDAGGYDHYSTMTPNANGKFVEWIDTFSPSDPDCVSNNAERTVVAGVHGGIFTAWKAGTASYTLTAGWEYWENATVFTETQAYYGCEGVATIFMWASWGVWDDSTGTNAAAGSTQEDLMNSSVDTCEVTNWIDPINGVLGINDGAYSEHQEFNSQLTLQWTFSAINSQTYQPRISLSAADYDKCNNVQASYCLYTEPESAISGVAQFIGIS